MDDQLPSTVDLTPLQRLVLELIIYEYSRVNRPDWAERAILLWNDGDSHASTARKLKIDEETVIELRQRWWTSMAAILAAEQQAIKELAEFISITHQTTSASIDDNIDYKTIVAMTSLAALLPKKPPESAEPASASARVTRTKSSVPKRPTESGEIRPVARALIEILHHKPSVYGINRSNWTYNSLADAYAKQYGQRPSASSVGRILKAAGCTWKNSRRVLTSPDPNYRDKVELLLRTLRSLKEDEDLFFIDELGPLKVRRFGGKCLTPKNETPSHPQNQRGRGSVTLNGALSAKTNQLTWFYGDTKDSTGMIDLVEILFNQRHGQSRIYITWDAASWHGSDKLVEWVNGFNAWNQANTCGPQIEFVPLPSSAQFLNVIEAVFKAMKKAVIHFSDYQSEEEMKNAISLHFVDRNTYFMHNPRRAGKKIWEIDFFKDPNCIRSGNYRE
jgi:hypothetical protein